MKIGYVRVSRSDQTHALQTDALKAAGCERIYEDTISGARASRPGFTALLDHLRPGDEVLVWKMDRLGRSLVTVISMIDQIAEKGAGIVSITEAAINTTGPHGKLILHVLSAVAEYERALIRERTTAGLVQARKRGARIGRPRRLTELQAQAAVQGIEAGHMTRADAARTFGVSIQTISRLFAQSQTPIIT